MYDPNTGSYSLKGARGKYFCKQYLEELEEERATAQEAPSPDPEEIKEKDCSKPEEWDSSCGFVNPDSLSPEEAFAFQAAQRDTLIQNMSVRPDSMEAVTEAQKYMNWVIDKAMLLSDMYGYSAVQNPDLDPNADHSASSFAQQLISSRNLDNREMFWTALRSWGAEIVMFTRKSCDFCKQQDINLQDMLSRSGMNMVEVALEEECVSSQASTCIRGEAAQKSAQRLGIEVVPTTLVYVPNRDSDNPEDGLWMRVSNGYSTGATISRRIYKYLNAWHSAALKGMDDATSSPDFQGARDLSRKDMYEKLNNVVGNTAEGEEN